MSGSCAQPGIDRTLPRPEIDRRDGRPHSRRFSDIYHTADASAAARAVFLDGNRLAGRFADARGCFVIGELGFGLGVNFLAAVELWRTQAPASARLHYVAVEGFPPDCGQIASAQAALGCDRAATDWLCRLLPERWPGWHHVDCGDGISLTLIHQQARPALADADFAADAWFLDGFAPDRNPDMWEAGLLADVGRLTVPGGSCATYSSAARVREGLAAAGFDVFRRPGFAGKRQMLCGRKPGRPAAFAAPENVLVIGAGIAGCCVARSLQRRGIRTQLLAARSHQPASTVPRLLQTPRVAASMPASSRLSLACFAYARAQALAAGGWQCGALMLAHNQAQQKRRQRISRHRWPDSLIVPMNADEASDCAGVPVDCDALWIPQAVTAYSAQLLARLPAAQEIDQPVAGLARTGSGLVATTSGGERFFADATVLCCAASAADLVSGIDLNFSLRAGVALRLQLRAGSSAPRVALLYGHVLNPDRRSSGGWLSASDCGPGDGESGIDSHLPGFLSGSYSACPATRWKGVRVSLSDRLPAAGPAGEGVHMLSGLGSRGHALAFLLAEAVVARMTGEPPPLPVSLLQAVDPGRFGESRQQARHLADPAGKPGIRHRQSKLSQRNFLP